MKRWQLRILSQEFITTARSRQLHNALALRQKYDDPVSVMMLDLDLFKSINDTYGHSTGDAALRQFAAIMKDIASDDNTSVGRWGGEEFVIVCRDKNADAAKEMAEKIREKVEEYQFSEIYHLTCSIGVTELQPEDDFTKAFNRLDKEDTHPSRAEEIRSPY